MEEKALIAKIRELGQIKPDKDWVFLTKERILGQEAIASQGLNIFLFKLKPAYAGLFVFMVLVGLFGVAQNALPGDSLYTFKKITERVQLAFVPEEELPTFQLRLAAERLEDLTKARAKNLAPTINEFQASISEATKSLSKIDAASANPTAVKRVVDEAKKIEKKTQEVKSLGVVIEEKDIKELQEVSTKLELGSLVSVLKNMISDLENKTLTEKQEKILSQMKELVEEEKYSEALELYLVNQ